MTIPPTESVDAAPCLTRDIEQGAETIPASAMVAVPGEPAALVCATRQSLLRGS
jgi:hypothetical protein